MRTIVVHFLLIALTGLALAQTPEKTVKQLYETHQKLDMVERTTEACKASFTPEFLALIRRAASLPAGSEKGWLDYDIFCDSQAGWYGFEVHRAYFADNYAVVPVSLYSGRWPQVNNPKDMAEVRSKVPPHPARIHLVDLGRGYQIYDIEFLPSQYKLNGKVQKIDGHRVRPHLRRLTRN